MAATTVTGSRSMRSISSSVCRTTSLIFGSVSKLWNSRMSAPATKLVSLALISTRPLTSPLAAAVSTAPTISPSSSVGRRPSEFMLSPLRSMIAQAMPSKSIEKRQSCKFGSVAMITLLSGYMLRPVRLGTGCLCDLWRRSCARDPVCNRCGIELVHSDDPRHEIAKLSKIARLRVGQHALDLSLSDPVVVVETPHLALADGALELL